MSTKGIILAGGTGSRLFPSTLAACKQLLPVYDKPMIYYPLSIMMMANIRDVLIISTPEDLPRFERLFGDGTWIGMNISYAEQAEPRGIAEAFVIGADFIGNDRVALVLGDNILFGGRLRERLITAADNLTGATVFAYPVRDPERYGVVEIDAEGKPTSIVEKPKDPKSNLAVTGLYFYDSEILELARDLKPSARGELDVTDINRIYLERGQLHVEVLGRGYAWLDAGTEQSLLEASNFVAALCHRQGQRIACLEEIAFEQHWIDEDTLRRQAEALKGSGYGEYLVDVLKRHRR